MKKIIWALFALITPGVILAELSETPPPRLEVSSFVTSGTNAWIGLLVGEKQEACILKVGQGKLGVRLEKIDYAAGRAWVEHGGEHYILSLRTPGSKELKLAEVPEGDAAVADLSIDLQELVREYPDARIKVPTDDVPVVKVAESLGLKYDQKDEAPADEDAFKKVMESRGIRRVNPRELVSPMIPDSDRTTGATVDSPVLDTDPDPQAQAESTPDGATP